jgi:hypothetical protein
MSTSSLQTANEERKPVLSTAIVHPDVKWKRGIRTDDFDELWFWEWWRSRELGRAYLQTDEVLDMIRAL